MGHRGCPHSLEVTLEDTAMSSFDASIPAVKDAAVIDRYLWEGGTTMAVVLDAADTRGKFALLDQHGVAGDATPLHRHLHEDEAFYVLEGDIVALAGNEEHDAAPGCALFLPRGLPHAFMITSESARLLIITAPTGFEQFVRKAGIPVPGEAPTKWDFDLDRMMGPAKAAGVEILGPPPFARPPV
jgi:quercetin dioxygenase-like cupin family protein